MGKPIVAPTWARPEDVKGYTASQCIDPSLLDAWMKAATTRDPRQVGKHFLDHDRLADACRETFKRSSLPSVYYSEGHATLQHRYPGWEGSRKWLFFQNVSPDDGGHFDENKRAQEILTALEDMIKHDPKLQQDPDQQKKVFTRYVARHLNGKTLAFGIRSRAAQLKADLKQTARLILAAVLCEEYGTYCSETTWNSLGPAGSSKTPSTPELLEIYEESILKLHPSRHRFFPTFAKELKTVLHCLAISPAMWDANPHIQKNPNHKRPPSGRRTEVK